MTKIRLNNQHRDILRKYGQDKISALIDRKKEHALYATILEGANKAIRKKYPEADMAVLRRYSLGRQDRCLRFQFPSTRIDGFTFAYEDVEKIADVPSNKGCYSSDVYVVDAAFEKAYDDHAKIKKANEEEWNKKLASFHALIDASKTLDDVLAVIELPKELQERLGKKCTALVALSPDTLKSLRKDFAIKQAA